MNRRMRWILTSVMGAIFATIGLLVVAQAAMGSASPCAITYVQDLNKLTYTVTWDSGLDFNNLFQFGDGSGVGFDGVSGQQSWGHNYAYLVNGLTYYTPTVNLTLTEGVVSCYEVVTIDNRPATATPTATHTPAATATQTETAVPTATPTPHVGPWLVYMPLVRLAAMPPSVLLTGDIGPQWNHVVFHTTWSNGAAVWHRLDFGDSTGIDIFGASGDEFVTHDYAYPGGEFQVKFTVTNTTGTTVAGAILQLHP